MDLESITPAEFRKLQLQVDILQRFLTRTFGSSFLDFCKQAQLPSGNNGKGIVLKSLPPLNKAQVPTPSNGAGGVEIKKEPGTNRLSNGNGVRKLPPPPLLHRATPGWTNVAKNPQQTTGLKVTSVSSRGAVVKREPVAQPPPPPPVEDEQEFYDDVNQDIMEFIQPETVFSDDEQGNSVSKKTDVVRNGTKRGHSMAFGYDENEAIDNENGMQLPEGTECIALESDEQGQNENYVYQQDEELYGGDEDVDGVNNGDEMYEDEYYGMVDEKFDVNGTEGGNYSTEELHTDGNVTFGTVITSQDTGVQYFQCAFCPSAKVFKHKQSLKEHYLLNHSPTPPAYQCQCGRRFLKASQLKRHEVVHTAERPFVCPVCGKDFTRKDNMTVHMVRNHAEKKHQCPICPDKIYATPAEVNRHLRMYHSQWQQ